MAETIQPTDKMPISVLCVDDEKPHLDILSRFVSPYVCELYKAENGAKGFSLFLDKKPDVVLTDVMMPGVDGLEMCRMIKEVSSRTPLILLTASNSIDYLSEAIDIGINQFVPKPVNRSRLITSLERCYSLIQLERQLRTEHNRSQLLSSALEQSQTGVMILDLHGSVEYLNQSCARMICTSREETPIGRQVSSLGIPADLRKWVFDVAVNGHPVELETETGSSGTAQKWLNLKISRFDNSQDGAKIFLSIDDITERKCAEKKLRYLATHDQLTGLYNRGYFEEELQRITVGRSFPISLVIADIDRLKAVNDRYGHETGDRLIVKASEALRETFRAEDVVARIGGDEFAVILPTATEAVVIESIRRGLNKKRVIVVDSEEIEVSLSFGCATATDSGMVREMLKLADSRMYHEKAAKSAPRTANLR